MSTLTRQKVWVAGDILTASDQNNEFNNILNDYNGSINHNNIGTVRNILFSNSTSTDTLDITSSSTGAALVVRSGGDAFELSGTGIIKFGGSYTPGWVSNLGMTLSGGTLTVTDATGTALSTTNPGWVACRSTTAGLLVPIKITAPSSFNDDAHASSDLTNLGFGITEANGWANDHPFFLYVANRANSNVTGSDGDSVLFLSRDPRMSTTPSSANDIGDTGAIPVNDSQNVILILDDVTVANYTSLPCQVIGAIRMRWSSANTDWTVQALGNTDGFGRTALDATYATDWTMPLAQNGAAAGTYMLANGGTAAIFTTNIATFRIRPDGTCRYSFFITGDGGTDGAGAVDSYFALPYTHAVATQVYAGTGIYSAVGASTNFIGIYPSASAATFRLYEGATGTVVLNSSFSNGARYVALDFDFRAFG